MNLQDIKEIQSKILEKTYQKEDYEQLALLFYATNQNYHIVEYHIERLEQQLKQLNKKIDILMARGY